MASATITVAVEYSTWRARAWIRICRMMAPIIGGPRAVRWAVDGAYRLVRFRIAGRKWRHLRIAKRVVELLKGA